MTATRSISQRTNTRPRHFELFFKTFAERSPSRPKTRPTSSNEQRERGHYYFHSPSDLHPRPADTVTMEPTQDSEMDEGSDGNRSSHSSHDNASSNPASPTVGKMAKRCQQRSQTVFVSIYFRLDSKLSFSVIQERGVSITLIF